MECVDVLTGTKCSCVQLKHINLSLTLEM